MDMQDIVKRTLSYDDGPQLVPMEMEKGVTGTGVMKRRASLAMAIDNDF